MTCFEKHQTVNGKQEDAIENIGHSLFVDSSKQEQSGACCSPVCLFVALFIERQTEQEASGQSWIRHFLKVPRMEINTQCNH